MKNILYIDLSSFQNHRVPKSPTYNLEMTRQTQLFQKYFPKYLKQFSLASKNGLTMSKIKRTKIIQNFETSNSLSRPKSWRLLLANKSKTVRILQNSNNAFYQFPQQIRFLQNLHRIHATMPAPTRITSTEPEKELDFHLTFSLLHFQISAKMTLNISSKNVFDFFITKIKISSDQFTNKIVSNCGKGLKKTCRMMSRLRNLQYLKISELSTQHKNFLISLNKSQRFLSSLKKFSLCWNEKMTPSSNYNLLYAMPIHKNLSKYVTNLDLGNLCIPAHFFNFQYLAGSVPQLSRLAFRYEPPKVYSKEIGNFFEALKKFQNLKSLDIKIADLFMFIKGFVAPPTVQNLKLYFEECFSQEMMRKFDKSFIETEDCGESELLKILQENEIISRFCQNLQAISSLKSLETAWKLNSSKKIGNYEKYQNCFSQCMLTGIASLESLTYNMWIFKPWDFWNFDLPHFLEACLGSSQTLKTLEIGNEDIQFPLFDLSGLEKKFTKLSDITITGEFSEENNVYLLLKELVFLGDSLQKIKLQVILGEDMGPFVPLLQQINQLHNPSQAQIEVQIRFKDELEQEDIEDLIKLIKDSQEEYSREGIYFKILSPFKYDISRVFDSDTLRTNLKKRFRYVCQEKFKNCEILDSEDFY